FYYSVPQLLAFAWDPLTAAYASILLFAGVGYWGTYVLLRRGFACGRAGAIVGATLYMFNGFYAHRMIVGHFVFQGVMLIPWMAECMLAGAGEPVRRTSAGRIDVYKGLLAGLCGAYWIYAGMTSLVIPAALAVALIVCVHGLSRPASFSLSAL